VAKTAPNVAEKIDILKMLREVKSKLFKKLEIENSKPFPFKQEQNRISTDIILLEKMEKEILARR
jgi:hypothetical protein